METTTAAIGSSLIEIPTAHIYNSPTLSATYDYVPWNLIGSILVDNDILDAELLDVGANVGDSLAHFRRLSKSKVTCVEASPDFFAILERNARIFQDVRIVNKLLSPPELIGRVKFQAGGQTGSSGLAVAGEAAWSGPSISLDDLISDSSARYVFKTDTDGFDGIIVQYMCQYIEDYSLNVPIVFFEGPSAQQIAADEFDEYIACFGHLTRLGYKLLFLTNHGLPYSFADGNMKVIKSMMNALRTGYLIDRALCHYFDIIAVQEKFVTPTFKLEAAWNSRMFRTD